MTAALSLSGATSHVSSVTWLWLSVLVMSTPSLHFATRVRAVGHFMVRVWL